MSSAKTSAERVHGVRERRRAQGLVRLELWLHPDDHQPVKDCAAKLQRKRDRAAKKGGGTPPA